jgi:hypothetical protein
MNGNGWKMLGAVVVIAGLVVTMMGQRMNGLADDIRDIKEGTKDHAGLDVHAGAGERLAKIGERFTEIETQFGHEDRFIRLLWFKATGEALPAIERRSD